MAILHYEMFCHLVYSEDLSYDELIELENNLMPACSNYLQTVEASYIDFEQHGDSLHIQCVFTAQDSGNFKKIATDISEMTGEWVEGRIVFLGKSLDIIYCFFIVNGKCQSSELSLPSPKMGLAKRPPRLNYEHESITN